MPPWSQSCLNISTAVPERDFNLPAAEYEQTGEATEPPRPSNAEISPPRVC